MSLMYAARIPAGGRLQPLPSPAFDFGTGDFTVAATIMSTQGGTIVAHRDASAPSAPGFRLSVDDGGTITFATFGPTGTFLVFTKPTAAIDGGCHSLICVRRGPTLQILFDGSPLEVRRFGNARPPVDVRARGVPLTLGASFRGSEPDDQFLGILLNVGVWSVALSGDALVRATFGRVDERDAGLQGYWPLNGSTEDLSVNQNAASIVGPVTYAPCIDCVWTSGGNGYVFCQMHSSPSSEELEQLYGVGALTQTREVDVPAGAPALCASIMAAGEAPAFPAGARVTLEDPQGRTYASDVNTDAVFVTTRDGQPWGAMFVRPTPGRWTVTVTAPATTAFLLSMQTVPATDVVATVEAVLDPLYGPTTPLLERDRIDTLGGWLKLLAKVAVAALVGVTVAGLVVATGGAALPAIAAGIVAFGGVAILEAADVLGAIDAGNRDQADVQIAGMAGFVVAVQTVLLVDANVAADPATELQYKRRRKVLYPYVTASPFNGRQQELVGRDDTRAGLRARLLAFDAGYVSAAGHGQPRYLTGWYVNGNDGPLQEVLTEGRYDPREVRGKIVHIFGCWCGFPRDFGLGRDVVRNGALAFFGYSEPFAIVTREYPTFCDCDIEIDRALIDGRTCGEAHRAAIARYDAAIARFRAGGDVQAAATLELDRDRLVSPSTDPAYGNPAARLDNGARP